MVYVIAKDGTPLMPCTPAKARHLLKEKKATIVERTPFTIKLKFDTDKHVAPVTLGIDPGARFIGLSATTEKKVLFEAKMVLRFEIKKLLNAKKEARHKRRHRKRHRPERFLNRKASMQKERLMPSQEARIASHMQIIEGICRLLPISKIIIEEADFDLVKILDPSVKGKDYQHGEQYGFQNVRNYVLTRDGYRCNLCGRSPWSESGTKTKTKLEVHHIVQRKNGGTDRPVNLVTLCHNCHRKVHERGIQVKPYDRSFFDAATFMMILMKELKKRLCVKYGSEMIETTFGYITHAVREEHELGKEHNVDARCISGHPDAEPSPNVYTLVKVRCHNRKMYNDTIFKKGIKRKNQSADVVKGFRLWDKVLYEGQTCFIAGKRTTGYFSVRTIEGVSIHTAAKWSKLRILEKRRNIIISNQ